ncbi:antibiotic biosynthesis monooxygenase [Nocardioides psychrotolerans]|uniref:antibiotic biosynthesis monooxygenase family protein n=1 Tax=Nocardioides psychrotolerans TaxID=1005945 RepID=UPI00313840B0
MTSSPVLEHALLHVRAGQAEAFEAAMAEALPLIRRQTGCLGVSVTRCVEAPETYLLLVTWASIEDHETGFRGSADYEQWRALLHHFYDPFPTVTHFAAVDGLGALLPPD